ncbi:MAG: PLP-dependent aminotransferase family protein [Ruminococcaceae bacterium]|nr:PLP-dependent aminotransferase family protein [Oscillospiraceae bacterium]
MKYFIEEQSGKTAYMQLYEQLRADIVKKVYPYGKKLPSKRLLAEEAGISVITVEHAYGILCDEGYAEARQRSGYFVIYKESDFWSSADTVIPAPAPRRTVQHSDFEFPYSLLAKTMRRVLLDYGEELLAKSPNHGCAELRLAISSYLDRSLGIRADARQIIIGSGAEYLYSLIVQLLGNDRIYAIENPSYEKIRRVYKAHGAECDPLKLGQDGIKSSELSRTAATVLHITPFNSFPSGITASVSKRMEYLRFIKERNGYIIEDNYDSELTVSRKNEDTVFSLSKDGSVIYLNTFSKTIAPSMRVGYMVLPEALLSEFEKKLGFYSCTVPVLEQYVLAELISSGDFERHINRVRRMRRKNG